METFVYVYAWILGSSVLLRAIVMAACDYPRSVKTSLGQDTVSIMISIALLAWAIFLLNM
jgi:hypothetical protein